VPAFTNLGLSRATQPVPSQLLLRSPERPKEESLGGGRTGDIAEVAAGGDRFLQVDQSDMLSGLVVCSGCCHKVSVSTQGLPRLLPRGRDRAVNAALALPCIASAGQPARPRIRRRDDEALRGAADTVDALSEWAPVSMDGLRALRVAHGIR